MKSTSKKSKASAAATRKGRRAARGSEASRDFYEAIERILTLGGVACQPGWFITDVSIRWKLDTARENLERLINEKPQNEKGQR
jgi:hypothetical protein